MGNMAHSVSMLLNVNHIFGSQEKKSSFNQQVKYYLYPVLSERKAREKAELSRGVQGHVPSGKFWKSR